MHQLMIDVAHYKQLTANGKYSVIMYKHIK